MKVKWLGHSCFLITSDSGVQVLTDPYREGALTRYESVKEWPDIVTISHDHPDHNYIAELRSSPKVLQGAGKHQVNGLEFTGIPCYHDKAAGRERGSTTIFCFTVDDIRVCHCGDLSHVLDEAAISSLGRVDILFMPTGGPPTLELQEAVGLWERIKPSVIIPMHFRNEKCNFPKYGIDDLLKMRPKAVRSGKTEARFIQGRLPRGQILILQHEL